MKLGQKKIVWLIIPLLLVVGVAAGIRMWMNMDSNQKNDNLKSANYAGHGGTFKNALAEFDTPDPSIVYHEGYYYMTFTHNGTDIMILKSRTIDFRQAQKKVVWYPPVGTKYSSNLWAPEIRFLQGKWYIYFAADDGANENHRMYALESETEDALGEYAFKGKVADATDRWAIDGIVFERENKLYMTWSGWEGDVNIQQNTYIAPMSNPYTISGPRVMINEPDQDWEKAGGPPYINEGQAILEKNGKLFLMYSGAGSWTPFYSLGLLELAPGADPLQATNWKKHEQPLLVMDEEAGVYGPGHNTFVSSPDGEEDWIIYHATSGIDDGWNNRKARAQKITWSDDGNPVIGKPLSLDTAINVPSGEGIYQAKNAIKTDDRITFDLIPSSLDADVPLLVHYRNTTGKKQQAEISVNGAPVSIIDLDVNDGEAIGYAYTDIPLSAGLNEISLKRSVPGIELEAIEIPRYEAENAQAIGEAAADENPFASGWGIMKLPASEKAAISFDNVSVPRDGEYRLRIALSNASDKEAEINMQSNEGKKKTVKVPTTERNHFIVVELQVSLRAGSNEINFTGGLGQVLMDYLDVMI